ncbi:MAG: CRTAC1 family protein, partial [Flavobacterium sp.]|nr:CRTAC1 family protein [Pedobacter sp.]
MMPSPLSINCSSFPISFALLICTLLFQSCKSNIDKDSQGIFKLLDPQQTNVTFSNNITESDSLNILDYLYFYNGAGVASADFNNDGLEDLYFISNQESNKFYLNTGGLKFKDITDKAVLKGSGNWKTGVTVVDINNDGFKDIYVSVVSGYKSLKGKNQLYINNGNLTFTDKAADYGLDFAGLSTQASFFDYDKDGDLDMFLLTHSVHSNDTYGDSTLRFKYNEIAGDHLFRNDNNYFTDVTKGSGIYAASIGYGLGITISDFNNDGWDDIYISNDFFEQDYYYINQQNGKFKEKLKEAFGHTSLFSMGSAAGDINLDGNMDMVSTDMLPSDMKMLKSTINDEPLDIYNLEVKAGFYYQNSRNSLQLNVANGQKFVDIGLYSGVAATDWTWSPLIQDFDMDGQKDLFFSNGIKKRLNDLDYLKYLGDGNVVNDFDKNKKFDRTKVEKMPDGRVANVFYRGDSALKFTDVSDQNDMKTLSASAGTVNVDLDNDGDLEIVTNNMNEPAYIYQNNRILEDTADHPSFITYSLKFNGANIDGIGTKLYMRTTAGKVDHQEIQTSTAFQSSQNNNLLFTFSKGDKPLAVLVVWPDNSYQTVKNLKLGRQKIAWNKAAISLAGKNISGIISEFIKGSSQFKYENVSSTMIAELKISQTPDFNYYSLLPHTYLKHTPAIA